MGSALSRGKKAAADTADDLKDDAVDEFNEYKGKAKDKVNDYKEKACDMFDDGSEELSEFKDKASGFVDDKIKSSKVALFIKDDNHDSEKAQEILETYNLSSDDFEVINCDKVKAVPKADYIQSILREKTGVGKPPRIFIGGESIGGLEELIELDQGSKLREMLEEVGCSFD